MPRRPRPSPDTLPEVSVEADVESVWDESRQKLSNLYEVAAHLFPRHARRFSRVVQDGASGDFGTLFFAAGLACGHVVRIPQMVAAVGPKSPLACKNRLPCYKCWLKAGNTIAAPCTFCGRSHLARQACSRPHPAG